MKNANISFSEMVKAEMEVWCFKQAFTKLAIRFSLAAKLQAERRYIVVFVVFRIQEFELSWGAVFFLPLEEEYSFLVFFLVYFLNRK